MKILRQSAQNRAVHWGVAISIFGLIFTGILQMPVAKRYFLTEVPGLKWSGDFIFSLNLHYFFAATLIFFAVFHAVFHSMRSQFDIFPRRGDGINSYRVIKAMISGGEEPASGKYLPEQRLAYVAIALTIFVLIASGLVKTYKNILGLDISNDLYYWAATVHNIGMVMIILLIIAHLLAFVPKANRNLLPSMFSGKIDEEYAKERHSLWDYKKEQK